MNELYRQEIMELTDLLQNEENWSDLREVLTQKNYILKDIVLVSFMEDDEENEYGVFVTIDEKVFEYVRSTANGKNNINYFKCKDITNLKEEMGKYPQVQVAFEMIKNGEIFK